MKIAYFTPVSPQKTGIADYSEYELIPFLSKYVEIDIFIDEKVNPTNESLKSNFNIFCYTEFESRKDQYDIALYHMGNNQFHEFIYRSLLKHPGITVIHDIYLHGFLYNITLSRGDKDRYLEEFAYCYGDKGLEIANTALRTGVYPDYDYPLLKRILDHSIGIICHSDFGISRSLAERRDVLIKKVNHPLKIPEDIRNIKNINLELIKESLSLKNRFPIITSFGFIFSHKRPKVLMGAFKKFLQAYPDALLLLVGEDLMEIDREIRALGLENSVVKTGYVSFDKIVDYISVSDFCVNLRYPTAGETSGSVLRIMAAEKPVIVSNIGWFSELPEDCCLKVDVDSYEEDTLIEFMKALASNDRMREVIGKNAKNLVLNDYNPEVVAQEYYQFIKEVINGNGFVYKKISECLISLFVDEKDSDLIRGISEKAKYIL